MQTYVHMGEERRKDTSRVKIGLRISKGRGDEKGRKSTKVHLKNIITISNIVYSHFFKLVFKKILHNTDGALKRTSQGTGPPEYFQLKERSSETTLNLPHPQNPDSLLSLPQGRWSELTCSFPKDTHQARTKILTSSGLSMEGSYKQVLGFPYLVVGHKTLIKGPVFFFWEEWTRYKEAD